MRRSVRFIRIFSIMRPPLKWRILPWLRLSVPGLTWRTCPARLPHFIFMNFPQIYLFLRGRGPLNGAISFGGQNRYDQPGFHWCIQPTRGSLLPFITLTRKVLQCISPRPQLSGIYSGTNNWCSWPLRHYGISWMAHGDSKDRRINCQEYLCRSLYELHS